MAAAQASAVYTAQAIEDYINQKFTGNQAVLEQRLQQAANDLAQCVAKLQTTGVKANQLAAKMVEDEQRISEVVANANVTRDGERLTHDKVVEIFDKVEAKKKDLESTIQINDQEATTANQSLRRDAAQEIEELRTELISKFGELEAQAELKKSKLQAWTAGFRIEVRDEFIRQGGVAGGRESSRVDGSSLKHDKKDLAVWKLVDQVWKWIFGTESKPSRSTSSHSRLVQA